MSYSPDQLARLSAEAHRQGGTLLPDRCEGRVVTFQEPKSEKITRARTCTCRNKSMFVTVYDPAEDPQEAKKLRARGAGYARSCAYCDLMGSWPRYAKALKETDDA